MEIENRAQQKNMLLYDKERGNRYPIYEDLNGTHIFSPNDMCIIDELEELLDAGIDAFRIEGLLQTEDYTVAVTKLYRQALDAYANSPKEYRAIKQQLLSEIEQMQQPHRPLDTGFFFKESVY